MSTPKRIRAGFLSPLTLGLVGAGTALAILAGTAVVRHLTAEARAWEQCAEASAAWWSGDFATAAGHYTLAIETKDSLPYPRHARAVCLAELGRLDAAREDLRRAAELGASSGTYHYHRAIVLHTALELREALLALDEAIAVEPRSEYHILRNEVQGTVALKTNDAETALRAFAGWIELEPGNPRAHVNIAWARALASDFDGAIASMSRAIELDPESPSLYVQRAEALRKLDDHVAALADYRRVAELRPNLRNLHTLAIASEKVRHWDGAAEAWAGCIQKLSDDYRPRGRRALALLFAGRVDDALADADRAVELAPEEPIPYLWRGIARLEAGHRVGARSDQTRAEEIDVLGSLKQREDFEAETWRLASQLDGFDSVQKFLIGNY